MQAAPVTVPAAAGAPVFAIESMERRVLLTVYPTHNATVGMNLDGFSEDATIGAFNDLSTIFRPWGTLTTPYQPDPTIPTTQPGGPFPANYPLKDAAAISYATAYPDGDYAVSYDGNGTVDFTGLGPGTSYDVGTHVGNHWTGVLHLKHDSNGGGILELRITYPGGAVTDNNPIRNLHIISPDADLQRSPTFRPVFLDKLPYWNGTLRFMDWLQTNENPVVNWADRTQVDRFSYVTGYGVPIERVIELANLVHKDPWINLPFHASDDYVHHVAAMLAGGLNPGLHVYVENSNELWNIQFQQSKDLLTEAWAATPANTQYLVGDDDFGNMAQLAGKHLLNVSNIFKQEFGQSRFDTQVRPILGAHIALKYWAVNALDFIERASHEPANHSVYGIAIAPYVGAQGDMNFLDNENLTPQALFDWMNSFIDGSLRTWTREHKQVANFYGLHLESYEAGQSLQAQNHINEDLKVAAQDDPRMGELYQHLINMWVQEGGDIFNNFSLANHYSINGYWGVFDRIDRATSVKFEAVKSMVSSLATANLSVTPVNLTGNRGETVHAYVDIDNASGVSSVNLTLNYDASRLDLVGASLASVLGPDWTIVVNSGTPGKVTVTAFSNGEPVASGGGHMLDFAFTVKAGALAGTAGLDIDTTSPTATRLNEGNPSVNATDGGIVVPVGATITGAPANGSEGAEIALASGLVGADGNVTYLWHVLAANGQVIANGTGAGFSFTPNDNGLYTVSLTVTDEHGNTGTASKQITVTNVAPVATINGGPTGAVAEGTPIGLDAGVTDPGADNFTYAWTVKRNGVTVANGTSSSLAFTPADDGDYVVTLTVGDDDGGTSETATRTFTVTNVAPAAVIAGAPAGDTPEGTPLHLSAGVTDPGSADTFTYAWTVTRNGVTVASGTDADFAFTPGDQGTYVVTLVVTDDDHASGGATATITAVNANPSASIAGAPGTSPEGTPLHLTGTASDPAGANDTLTYAWSVTKDGQAYGAAGSGAAYDFTPADQGTYVVTLTVSDEDGGSVTVTKQISVTNVAPTASIVGAPQSGPEGTAISLTSTVSDPGTADALTYAWSVTKDGAAYGAPGTGSAFSFTPGDDGQYVVTLTVSDGDGGTHTVTKTIDVTNVAPNVSIGGAPATAVEGTPIHLTSTVTDPGGANDAKNYAWVVTKDGARFLTGSGATFDFTPDDDGQYVVTLTVTDGDGGTGTASATIGVTNAAPANVAIGGAPVTSTEGATLHLTSSFTDAGSADTHGYLWTVTRNGVAYAVSNNTAATFDFAPADEGNYVVTLKVSDDDGGFATAQAGVSVSNVDPVASITGAPQASAEGTAVSLGSTVTDAGATDTFTYLWTVTKDGQAYGVTNNTGSSFTFTPDDEGSYVVTLTVGDGDGGSAVKTATIAVSNVDPVASIGAAPATSPEGTPISLTGSATDAGQADVLAYAWTVTRGSTQVAGGSGASFGFTPADEGSYVVSLTVTDGDGGSHTVTKTIAVTNVDPTVAINGAPATAAEGTPIHLTGTVTDPGTGDAKNYAWVVTKNGQDYLTGNSATFDFTPDDNGQYVVTLTVTDGDGGTGTASGTIQVTNAAPTGVAIGGAPATSAEGTAVSLTGSFADAGSADTHTYLWTVTRNGQPYAVANNTSAAFSFTPGDEGTYVVTFKVTDDEGASATAQATIGVSNVAPSASITDAPAGGAEGTAIHLHGSASDAGAADTLSLSWTVTRGGDTLASGAGADFTFTPDDEGDYVVTFTADDGDGGVTHDTKTIAVTNVAPAAAIDNAPATSPEGTAIHLTGTSSDPGAADALTRTWKVMRGTSVYATGTGSAFDFTPDDDGTYVVSFTVSDGDGGVTTDTKTITVTNVKATATIVNPPTAGVEGSQISLAGTFADPGTVDPHTYAWTVTKDGDFYVAGSGPGFSFTPVDEGHYVVTLIVTDDDAAGIAATAAIDVANANPVATLGNTPSGVGEGTTISVTGAATDAGTLDVLSYNWSVTKNGNPFAGGTTGSVSFTPDDDGTYVLTFTATDGDGGSHTITRQVLATNVAPTAAITGAPASSPQGATISLGRTVNDAGSADTFTYLWQVFRSGQLVASGTSSSFAFTPAAPGDYDISLKVTDDDGASVTTTASVPVTHVTFKLASLAQTDYGFDFTFTRPVSNFAGLNVNATGAGTYGLPDVTLFGGAQGYVAGSLVYDAFRGVYSFVATGGPLTNDSYTVTIGSSPTATDGWLDDRGEALDGNGDDTAGDAAVRTFVVNHGAQERVLTLPDFSRGPGQVVNVPGGGAANLPVRLNDFTGVSHVQVTIEFDPSLLGITGATGPAGWTTTFTVNRPGSVTIDSSGPALGTGGGDLLHLQASVPSTAAYGALGIIRFGGVQLNHGALYQLHANAAVQAVAYFGDASGSRTYGGMDATYIARVAAELDDGFDAYPRLDPRIVGDVTGDGTLSGLDANYVARVSVGLPQAQIPDLPAAAPQGADLPGGGGTDIGPVAAGLSLTGGDDEPAFGAADASLTLSLPANLTVRPGGTINVPINISAFDGIRSLDLTILYNTSLLDLSNTDVTLGLSGGGWTLVKNVNDATGRLRLTLYRVEAEPGGPGSMLNLGFKVPLAAPGGASASLSLAGQADEGAVPLAGLPGSLLIDAVPPTVLSAKFDALGGASRLTVRFSEDVGASLSTSDLALFDALAQAGVDPSKLALSYDPSTFTATITFPGFAGGVLASGNYRLTIAGATVTDLAGNALDGASTGTAGSDFVFAFDHRVGDLNGDGAVDQTDRGILVGAMPGGVILTAAEGDANGDHVVDFNDLVAIAQHYNGTGSGAAEGDLNGDGLVDFNDLVRLAQHYNTDGRGDLNGDGLINATDLAILDAILNPPAGADVVEAGAAAVTIEAEAAPAAAPAAAAAAVPTETVPAEPVATPIAPPAAAEESVATAATPVTESAAAPAVAAIETTTPPLPADVSTVTVTPAASFATTNWVASATLAPAAHAPAKGSVVKTAKASATGAKAPAKAKPAAAGHLAGPLAGRASGSHAAPKPAKAPKPARHATPAGAAAGSVTPVPVTPTVFNGRKKIRHDLLA